MDHNRRLSGRLRPPPPHPRHRSWMSAKHHSQAIHRPKGRERQFSFGEWNDRFGRCRQHIQQSFRQADPPQSVADAALRTNFLFNDIDIYCIFIYLIADETKSKS